VPLNYHDVKLADQRRPDWLLKAGSEEFMGRPSGARSRDHDARRSEILQRMARRLSERDAMHASYRELVEAAGVSISTLQHYFGRREDIVAAVLQQAQQSAAPHFAHVRQATGTFRESILDFLAYFRLGFECFGVGDVHALGLVEGLRSTALGPVMVDAVLEPSIDALTARLSEHQRRGEMRTDSDPRHAALMLIAPGLLLILHQRELGGAARHPADLERFFAEHAAAFLRAHEIQK
jgi:AcrR family transcriptional regulator